MDSDLESPAGESDDWSRLYRARGDEITPHRPIFTGDVFETDGRTATSSHRAIVLHHPCAMRIKGLRLVPRLIVATVQPASPLPPSQWTGHTRVMPLPDLIPTADDANRHFAALFNELELVEPPALGTRIACLSPRGVNILLQRWVHHNSRVTVPTPDFNKVVSGPYEEADLIEEWCDERAADGISADDAAAECLEWLREDLGEGQMRQLLLEDEQERSTVRIDMRKALAALRGS